MLHVLRAYLSQSLFGVFLRLARRLQLKPPPPFRSLSPPYFAPMPASGLQALLMWLNCEAMHLGTDRFSAEAITIRVNPIGQYTYVGLYFQLVNWTAMMSSW